LLIRLDFRVYHSPSALSSLACWYCFYDPTRIRSGSTRSPVQKLHSSTSAARCQTRQPWFALNLRGKSGSVISACRCGSSPFTRLLAAGQRLNARLNRQEQRSFINDLLLHTQTLSFRHKQVLYSLWNRLSNSAWSFFVSDSHPLLCILTSAPGKPQLLTPPPVFPTYGEPQKNGHKKPPAWLAVLPPIKLQIHVCALLLNDPACQPSVSLSDKNSFYYTQPTLSNPIACV
jgi:hypothetical protein